MTVRDDIIFGVRDDEPEALAARDRLNEFVDRAEADQNRLDLIIRIFRVFDGFSWLSSEELFWRTNGEYTPFKIFVLCNDLFHWGCADLEEITAENIGELEAADAEVKALTGDNRHADELFCCRVRKMRPQRPCYEHIDEKLRPLFNACGPEREQ